MNRLLTIIFISLFFVSCFTGGSLQTPYLVDESRQKENLYYIPSTPNTPLSSETGHLHFNFLRSSGNKYSGVELQGGIIPAEHLGIIASFAGAKNSSSEDFTDFHRFNVGAGYVGKISKRWHVEVYSGWGKGQVSNHHFTGYSNIDLNEFFVQPAIAYSNPKKTVEIGLISRFTYADLIVKDAFFDHAREPYNAEQVNRLAWQPTNFMWEPALILRAGWKNFKFHGGYTVSTDLNNPSLNMPKGNLSLGASLQFNTAKK